MYFHTDDQVTIAFIENVARLANKNEQRLRIDVSPTGELRIKRGEGIWSPPIPSEPDPYRG